MAVYEEIQIDQGATFRYVIDLDNQQTGGPYNLSGFTSKAQIRKNYKSTVAYDFTVLLTPGKVDISMTDEQTAVIKAGRYVFDVIIQNPAGEVFRVLEGIVDVTPGVSSWV